MRIKKAKIENLSCFRDSGEFELSTEFNVVVGENNSGKSVLLSALSLSAGASPHRSLVTVPQRGVNPPHIGKVTLELEISGNLLRQLALSQNSGISLQLWSGFGPTDHEMFLEDFFKLNHRVTLLFEPGKSPDLDVQPAAFPFQQQGKVYRSEFVNYTINETRTGFRPTGQAGNAVYPWKNILINQIRSTFYAFRAERLNVGTCRAEIGSVLSPTANNLPAVLNNFSNRIRSRFSTYEALVRRVFPQIQGIDAHADTSIETASIWLWLHDPISDRDDLRMPLAACGTGIGQVLAMLYVVINSERPTVIIIDEPNSFLHPSATRALLEILREYPQHQYIISSHSAEVISALKGATPLLVKWEDYESKVRALDANSMESMREAFSSIGVRLSDVFGFDRLIWVEGTTEEICFPMILDAQKVKPNPGCKILGVKNTGDFDKSGAKLVLEIYNKLTSMGALLPPAIGFIFDKECRPKSEMEDLSKLSARKVHFIDRRCFENYLLHPDTVASYVNALEGFSPTKFTESQIREWLEKHGNTVEVMKPEAILTNGDISSIDWSTKVNGARVLEKLFSELSESRYKYDKVRDSVGLTSLILQKKPEVFKEIETKLLDVLANNNSAP